MKDDIEKKPHDTEKSRDRERDRKNTDDNDEKKVIISMHCADNINTTLVAARN